MNLPAIFVGHGSPMNAVATNEYTEAWSQLGAELKPDVRSVLIISAHWATRGALAVTTSNQPGVLYDFYGFPDQLYQVKYDAPGEPALARHIQERFAAAGGAHVAADDSRELDHGVWSILTHMFPDADIPCVQLSYNMDASPADQLAMGRVLVSAVSHTFEPAGGYTGASLRDQGVLILTSGNLVHNLREINFQPETPPFDWAIEFDEAVKTTLQDGTRDYEKLLDPAGFGAAGQLSVPTPDHYIPFLNFLGMIAGDDRIDFPCEGIQNGSISMRTIRAGITQL